MPIKIPDNLPARLTLEKEGVMVMPMGQAVRQDIRALRIGLLNLMPEKIKTETQFARVIGASPLQVDLSLIKMTSHTSKNTSQEHMIAFYRDWEAVAGEKFDGLIITGAPVEQMEFEDVSYWPELEKILAWTQTNVHSTFNVCWGAQASLYHFHKVPKHALKDKVFGVFSHRILNPTSRYLHGFADETTVPVSRWTEVRAQDLPADRGLEILLESDETGLCLINDPAHRQLYMFNHIEYDTGTLGDEYARDVAAAKPITPPAHYFPDGDPTRLPKNTWRSHAHLLFGNWINEVYQTTPYDLNDIGKSQT